MACSGKVALVTGGAAGIGAACVEELLKNGVKGVVIADTNSNLGKEVVKNLNEKYGNEKTIFVTTDVSDKQSFENAFQKTIEKYNNLDIVVNCAGIVDEYNWEKVIQVNLVGTTNGCLLAINKYFPKYRTSSQTYIINMSSTAGLNPFYALPHYSSTKHGITGLSKSLGTNPVISKENIFVMCLCPGGTDTPIIYNHPVVYRELYDSIVKEVKLQKPEAVGKAVIELLHNAESGSVWVIEDSVLHKVKISEELQYTYSKNL